MKHFERTRKIFSDSYQYKLREYISDDKYFDRLANNQSLTKYLNPFKYDERVLELQDELKREFWKLVEEIGTEKQIRYAKLLYMDGYTQKEAGEIMGVNQTSVVKAVSGNLNYGNKYKKIKYGGLIKKIQHAMKDHPKCLEIIKQIQELREEDY